MAQYKVLQDIEAEDKLVGPFTLRQFIYAAVTLICLYLCFIGITKHAIVIVPIFFPVALVSGFFAFPWSREQPTEIWALAKIRFLFKPRRRIWDQSGVKELVTVTAPKKVEMNYTNGLSQTEVKSRLKALADTIDTRGWAVKNVDVNLYTQPLQMPAATVSSDRLVTIDNLPQEVAGVDVQASDDILDEQNTVAQQFDQMIQQSTQAHRQQLMQQLSQAQAQAAAQPQPSTPVAAPVISMPQPAVQQSAQTSSPSNDYWFLNQQPAMAATRSQIVAPGTDEDALPSATAPGEPTAAEKALAEKLRQQNNSQGISYAHLRTLQPLDPKHRTAPMPAPQPPQQTAAKQPTSAMPPAPDPAIIALASNNDLNVATIARQANKQEPPDEVVISLH